MKKSDLIIIAVVLVLSLVLFAGIKLYQGSNDGDREVIIRHAGEVIQTYPFTERTDEEYFFVDGEETNHIVIKDGTVKMTEANCRDQICVKSHAISENSEIIVCLPHQLTVEIYAPETDTEIDGVAE